MIRMPSVGITLPELSGLAGLKPLVIYKEASFSTTGQQWLRSDPCPAGKLWWILYTTVGFNNGDVSDCLLELESSLNARLAILAMFPDLVIAESRQFLGSYPVGPGQKVAARFNVVTATPTCFLTAVGFELTYAEE